MNKAAKKRLVIVGLVIAMVAVALFAVLGSGGAATALSVSEAVSGDYDGKKVQVSGAVVQDSYTSEGTSAVFEIVDDDDPSATLEVTYGGAMPATFGNGVTAICTGKVGEDGVLNASELVTKCPSKYENATNALTVSQLTGYGDEVVDKPVKVAGAVKDGTLKAAGEGDRFVLVDPENGEELAVEFNDAISEEVKDGSSLVLTGSMNAQGKFSATEVALEG